MRKSLTPAECKLTAHPKGEIIFSLVDGFVWASWPGAIATVRLGPYQHVLAAMSDFQAQSALGERLMKPATAAPARTRPFQRL